MMALGVGWVDETQSCEFEKLDAPTHSVIHAMIPPPVRDKLVTPGAA